MTMLGGEFLEGDTREAALEVYDHEWAVHDGMFSRAFQRVPQEVPRPLGPRDQLIQRGDGFRSRSDATGRPSPAGRHGCPPGSVPDAA